MYTSFNIQANAELVSKFYVALHASHAALLMLTLNVSLYTNVTLTLGWTTLFMGDMGEGDLAPQVEGVSDETVIDSYGSCTTLTSV
jgi:hypothetical protein